MTIEKFEDMSKFIESVGSKFIAPDNSLWKFVEGQDNKWAGFQWAVYESESHPGVIVWTAHCGDAYSEEYQCDVWMTFSGKFIYLPSLEVWHTGLETGDYR